MKKRDGEAAGRLLTKKDIANRCQVSDRTVQRWIDTGDLIVHRLGRQVRISEEDFATFLKLRRN